jgi:hypothetical protein
MPASLPPALGLFALVLTAGGVIVVAAVCLNVKFRAASCRVVGVRVYDFGADLKLRPSLHSRSYQVALYFTMKSLPREPPDPATPPPRVNAPAASR